MTPHTTKRRTTTNLKTKNNQNFQIIKLYGNLTTKELKKKHSSRLGGGTETGSRGGKDMWQGSSWRTGLVRRRQWLAEQEVPHLSVDKLGGPTGDQDRMHNPGFQCGEIKSQKL